MPDDQRFAVVTGMGYLIPWGWDAGILVFYMVDHVRVWINAMDLKRCVKYELELEAGTKGYDLVAAIAAHMKVKGYPEDLPPLTEDFRRRFGIGDQAPPK